MKRLAPCIIAFLALGASAYAQFKEIGPPPYPPAAARQKIRNLIENVKPGAPQATVDKLFELAPWYRDILDEELIAAWRNAPRADLSGLLEPLADARVAATIVEFSWRHNPGAALTLTTAPLLGQLMERYPDSATPFLADLLAPSSSARPPLTRSEAEAVCRILVDMPDTGNWRKSAAQILPRYRQVAENLLNQDLQSSDREKSYRAQVWLRELHRDDPVTASQQPARRQSAPAPSASTGSAGPGNGAPPAPSLRTVNGRPTLARADSDPPAPSPAAPAPSPGATPPSLYRQATSGTLQCSGGPVPQNAEYVFRNLPLGNIRVEYDSKTWEAHLAPGDGQTQKLVLRNISGGPQKRCAVRWSVVP